MKINILFFSLISFLYANDKLGVSVEKIATDFERPILVTFQPDNNQMYVLEQKGKIKIINSNSVETFLDISNNVSSGPVPDERGLLGMAFDNKFSSNGIFFSECIK